MRVAVIQRYRRGTEVRKADMRETWGLLFVWRHEHTMMARLQDPSTSVPTNLLPPLYGAVMSCDDDRVHVTGVQRDGGGLHGQHWMGRLVSHGQMAHTLKDGGQPAMLDEAIYLHWWDLLHEVQGRRHKLPLAEALEKVGITQIDYWPFAEWADFTGRCRLEPNGDISLGQRDGVRRVFYKGPLPRSPDIPPSPPPADPMNPFAAEHDEFIARR